jgi:hypothetical protein
MNRQVMAGLAPARDGHASIPIVSQPFLIVKRQMSEIEKLIQEK